VIRVPPRSFSKQRIRQAALSISEQISRSLLSIQAKWEIAPDRNQQFKRTWSANCGLTLNWKKKNNAKRACRLKRPGTRLGRAFGNSTLIKEQTYEVWGWATFEQLSRRKGKNTSYQRLA
jgi:hypothetical protein